MNDLAALAAETQQLAARLRRMEELVSTVLQSYGVELSASTLVNDDGSTVPLSTLVESCELAAAAGDRVPALGLAVGLAYGIDRLRKTGKLNLVYGDPTLGAAAGGGRGEGGVEWTGHGRARTRHGGGVARQPFAGRGRG